MLQVFDILFIFSISFIAPIPVVRAILRWKLELWRKIKNYHIILGIFWLASSYALAFALFLSGVHVSYGFGLYSSLFLAAVSILLFAWSEKHLSFEKSMSFDIKQSAKLVTTGPYMYIRHPRYLSIILFSFSLFLVSPSLFTAVIFAYILISHYIFTIIEERDLVKFFGKKYIEYKSRVPRFLPRLFKLL
jgi:protein-S-isoprenylcysteine O-methyltransferase Ste14